MRILAIDTGVGAGHVLDLIHSGINVDYYIPWFAASPDEKPHLLLSGIANKVIYPEEDYDLVVVLDVGYHSFGMPYAINYSPLFSKLEVDRVLAKSVFKDLGIPVPDYKVISTENDTLPEYPELVLKTNWRGSFETKVMKREEAERFLRNISVVPANPIIAEQKIDGYEIGFDLIVSEDGAIKNCFYGFVYKATVLKACNIENIPYGIGIYLKALAQLAYESGFRGMFSAEFIVSREGQPYIMEVAARFPYITSLIYTYNYGFYNILRAVTGDYVLPDLGDWLVGIPVFRTDQWGDVVLDELDNHVIQVGKYQVVLSQVYKIGNKYKVMEWPLRWVGVTYGSHTDLKILLEDMTSQLLGSNIPFEIEPNKLLEANEFFGSV
jgi:hypothetical protein